MREKGDIEGAKRELAKSVNEFPWNASGWFDLARLCTSFAEAHAMATEGVPTAAAATTTSMRAAEGIVLRPHWMREFFIAKAALETQAHGAAKEAIEGLLKKFPRSRYLAGELAAAHNGERELEEAERILRGLHETDREDLDKMDILSNVLYVKEDAEGLSELAREAEATDRHRAETCMIVGNFHSLKGRHEEAIVEFERAVRLEPGNASALILLGHEYLEVKNLAASVRAYREATEVDEGEYRAWFGLAQAYLTLHQPLFALYYSDRACKLRPYDPRMWCSLAQCFEFVGEAESAIRAYSRAFSNDPRSAPATKALARLFAEHARNSRAAAFFHRADVESGEGDVVPALLFLASHHRAEGRLTESEACCDRILELGNGQDREQAKAILQSIVISKETK